MRASVSRYPSGFSLRGAALLLIAAFLLAPRLPAQSASGVIEGIVLDGDGTPITNLMVVAELSNGSLTFRGNVRTDSAGRYHLAVAPGQYLVKAGGCPQDAQRDIFQPCSVDAPIYRYFPDAASRSSATVIGIVAGASRTGVNITLSRAAVQAMQQEGARLQTLAPELWKLREFHNPPATASWPTVEGMHDYYAAKFISTPGMGSGRMSGMRLDVDPGQRLVIEPDKPQAWYVAQLDLIGIARHAHPVVFTRLAHGTYAESDRALTSFETKSLSELNAGKEVVSGRDEAGTMQVMGAIRAKVGCLGCHRSARDGTLLGALRYVLHPAR